MQNFGGQRKTTMVFLKAALNAAFLQNLVKRSGFSRLEKALFS